MARKKMTPEAVRTKTALSERLALLRKELFGERGGPELARRLGIPIRTWYNYEMGVTVPAEVILKIIEMTSVEPMWLLYGRAPKYRRPHREAEPDLSEPRKLIRAALALIEEGPVCR